MNGGAGRLWLLLAVVTLAALVATALCGTGEPPRVAGQPQPSLTPESQITIPGGRSLAPGEDVTFVQTPPPTPAPVSTPGNGPIIFPSRGGGPFSPVALHVSNASPGRVFVSLGAPDFTVTAFDDVLVQLTVSRPASLVGAPGPAVLSACGADAARGNVVRCRAFLSVLGAPATVDLTVTTVPEDTQTQTATLAAGSELHLVYPAPDGPADRLAPALSLTNTAGQPLTVSWDGATLGASTDAAVALTAGLEAPGEPPDRWPPESRCAEPPETPNALSCDLSGYPQVDATVRALPLAPQAIPPLNYRDRFGAGTLTITPAGADVAPGGEAVTVMIAAGDRAIAGQGVLRPSPFRQQFSLSVHGNDQRGAAYLYTGELKPYGETFAARGFFLGLGSPHLIGAWQSGDADAAQVNAVELSITHTVLNGANPPPPGLSLPMLADTLTDFDLQSHRQVEVGPPSVGDVGQPLTFGAIGPGPATAAPARWTFDWGDGGQGSDVDSQFATHAYDAPGIYTMVAIETDASGAQTFGATQIAIGPAS